MRYLCLPGAYGSAKNFQVQLGILVTALEARGNVEFTWTQGSRKAIPPIGFEDYFGAGPLWRFIDYDGSSAFDILEEIRDFPEGPNAEESMRLLMGGEPGYSAASVREAIHKLLDIIDADMEIEVLCPLCLNEQLLTCFQGILGYSEGATTAATLILEERRLWETEGRPRRIKRALFLAGWPPLAMTDENVHVLLADQSQDILDIPTLHVVGCNDPYIAGAVALYNMCERTSAELFDHGKGHTVPRDARTIQELCDAVERLNSQAENSNHPGGPITFGKNEDF
ncbi:serine hydrolase FSH [Coniella lustricola]|uniref:Serine hydrolase FSH n=1 Tax=Coniella lustricola TaxID=2025994 RepID=A0A2T3A3T2_9PEZI|nr:serine hydrolase FSH [Coniella lustricola]